LLGLKYEQLVQFLNDVPKTDFFYDPKVARAFVRGIKKFNITSDLLKRLDEEQSKICETSEKFINLMYPTKNEFKHYINVDGKTIAVYFST